VQILTGAFLTLYYAATPDHAYDSIRFIVSTTPGRIVRGLHHYGASFIVVAVLLHMVRVVAFGSYKSPREATWLSGLLLLGLGNHLDVARSARGVAFRVVQRDNACSCHCVHLLKAKISGNGRPRRGFPAPRLRPSPGR
jgi:hypothetical protein